MTKKQTSLSTLGAVACGSMIVLAGWTDTAAQVPAPRHAPCASGFKQVAEGGDMYRCEIVGSAQRICLPNYQESAVIDVEKSGANGWKIIYRCAKKPI